MPAMEDAGEGPAKRRKRDASGLKSGDRISYINRCAVVQDDLRLKETQTRDGGQKKANPSSNWRDLRPGEERYGRIWENLEQFAWEGPKETGKGDRLRSLKIDRNDGKGPVELYPAKKKDLQTRRRQVRLCCSALGVVGGRLSVWSAQTVPGHSTRG